MDTGIDFDGTKNGQTGQEVQGHAQMAAPSAVEAIPFEYRRMTKRELSEYLGVTERTIEVWMRRRYIPYVKIGQSVRFGVATVLCYLDEKYYVPVGERGRRCKSHRTSFSRGNTRPDAAAAPFHPDPCCDASGSPGA